jgi:branched-chain amino acid transport system substrate-binding protein
LLALAAADFRLRQGEQRACAGHPVASPRGFDAIDRSAALEANAAARREEPMTRPTGISRRKFMQGTATAGAVLASNFAAPAILAQTKKPLKLGVINSFTGAIAYAAENNLNAMSLHFDSIGWTIAGRKIEIIKEDDQFSAQVGLQKAKKLVESDGVDILTGIQASNVALAVLNYARQKKAFYVVTGAGADAITWGRNPYVFRTSLSAWQLSAPMAEWGYDHLAKDMVLMGSDYAGGRDVIAEFRGPFTKKGGKVMKEIYPPLGTTDFSPYLTDIRSMNPPAVYAFGPGTDGLRMMQQYQEMGLLEKAPMCTFAMIDSLALKALGKAAIGIMGATIYADKVDTPENKAFVAEYVKRFKSYPDQFSAYGITAARTLEEALKATDGDTSNKDKLAEAMKKVSFNGPGGPFKMDPVTHNPIQNVYICKCAELEGGRVGNTVVATVKDVRDPGSKQY